MNVIYPWKIRVMVVVLHVIGLAVFLTVGWVIGSWYGRPTLGLVTGLVVSFPLMQMASLRLIKRVLKSGRIEVP